MTLKKTNRKKEVDMSPNAIDMRLRELSQLYRLGKSIQSAKKIGKVKDINNSQRDNI